MFRRRYQLRLGLGVNESAVRELRQVLSAPPSGQKHTRNPPPRND